MSDATIHATSSELTALLDKVAKAIDSSMRTMRLFVSEAVRILGEGEKERCTSLSAVQLTATIAHALLWLALKGGHRRLLDVGLELTKWIVGTGFLPIDLPYERPEVKSEAPEKSIVAKWFSSGKEELANYEFMASGVPAHVQLASLASKTLVSTVAKIRTDALTQEVASLLALLAGSDAATVVTSDRLIVTSQARLSCHGDSLVELVTALLQLADGAARGRLLGELHVVLSGILSRLSQECERSSCGADTERILICLCSSCASEGISLELLGVHQSLVLQLVVNGGPVFRGDPAVLRAVRDVVFPLVVKCSLAPEPESHRLAFSCFVALFRHFKSSLAAELEAYFTNVIFKLLDSTVADPRHQCLLVDVLLTIVEEPSNLIDIFLNFDCHQQRHSVYEGILEHLAPICGGRTTSAAEAAAPQHPVDDAVRAKALSLMSLLVRANAQWIERFEVDAEAERQAALHAVTGEVQQPPTTVRLRGHERSLSEQSSNEIMSQHRQKKDVEHAILLFNQQADPSGAVEYLQDAGLVDSAAGVAQFLVDQERRLDKIVLGEYFSKALKRENVLEVFKQWTHLQHFEDLELDEALRIFLGGFKLVGEAQLVDKSVEIFADEFCCQNQQTSWTPSAAFVVSFAICMLNTDAHSPHVKDKMTLPQFIANNRGVNNGDDISDEILTGIYERVTSKEIVLRSDPTTAHRSHERQKAGLLAGIPVLQSIVPTAAAVVMYPFDKAGDVLFDAKARRQSEMQKQEFQRIFEDAVRALRRDHTQGPGTAASSLFHAATSLEHAIPMWDTTADAVTSSLFAAVERAATHVTARHDISSLCASLVECAHVCIKFGDFRHALSIVEWLHRLGVTASVPAEVRGACGASLLRIFVADGDDIPKSGWRELHSFANAALSLPVSPAAAPGLVTPSFVERAQLTDLMAQATDVQRYRPDTQVAMVVAAAECTSLECGGASVKRLQDMLGIAMGTAPRMQWREMWLRSSEQLVALVETAEDETDRFSCVIDAFSGLIVANLRRDESKGFQADTVRPLERLFFQKESARVEVVAILDKLVELRAPHLDAAWGVVLKLLGHCGSIRDLCLPAWAVAQRVLAACAVHQLVPSALQDVVQCVSSFAACPQSSIAMEALAALAGCGHWLSSTAIPSDVRSACWRTLQSCFIPVILSRTSKQIAMSAVDQMLVTLRSHGAAFEALELWPLVRGDLLHLVRRVCGGGAPQRIVTRLLQYAVHDFHRAERDTSLLIGIVGSALSSVGKNQPIGVFAAALLSCSFGASWTEQLKGRFHLPSAESDAPTAQGGQFLVDVAAELLPLVRAVPVHDRVVVSDDLAAAVAILAASFHAHVGTEERPAWLALLLDMAKAAVPARVTYATIYCCAALAADGKGSGQCHADMECLVERCCVDLLAAHAVLLSVKAPGVLEATTDERGAYASCILCLSVLLSMSAFASSAPLPTAPTRLALCSVIPALPSSLEERRLQPAALAPLWARAHLSGPCYPISLAHSIATLLQRSHEA